MNEISRKVLKHYQIRKTRKQKEEFCKFLVDELKQYGCMDYVQKNMMKWYLISRFGPSIGKRRGSNAFSKTSIYGQRITYGIR